MIRVENINKTFRVAKRNAGFGNAVKALFSREYERVPALQDVSFTIQSGEMVGYIGPNGAGKSTSIKIMCGILTPDSGVCEIDGRVPWKNRVDHAKNIGALFGQRSQLWWDVPVDDSFALLKDMYRIPEDAYNKTRSSLVDLLNLAELLKTPTRSLSLGQRMRCELAASLLHNPKILFLDEPTIGLDAVSKIAVRQFIKELNAKEGTTVILTTHDMQDIEALTHRILLIGKGRILLDGDLNQLKSRFSDHRNIIFDYIGDLPEPCHGMVYEAQRDGQLTTVITPSVCSVSAAIAHISAACEVRDISVSAMSAEEMVAALYEEYRI